MRLRASRVHACAWMMLALLLVATCSPAPTGEAHDLVVSNETTLAVSIAVNGVALRTIQPQTQETVLVKDLPPLPWAVEARTSTGRALLSMSVRAGDVRETTRPDGSHELKGDAVRIDLSCGRLDMWSGPPLLGPAPGPGKPGDCVP
jgi:hypothetical protein